MAERNGAENNRTETETTSSDDDYEEEDEDDEDEEGDDDESSGCGSDSEEEEEEEEDEEYESVTRGEDDERLSSPYHEMTRKKKRALLEFRCRVEDAILGNYLMGKPDPYLSKSEAAREKEALRGVSLWGVPLLPSRGHDGTDNVLLKFLRAKSFNVRAAFIMLQRTLKWRRDYGADTILDEDLGPESASCSCDVSSEDKEGRPLCYSDYGVLEEGILKCEEFLRWRIQYIEKGIRRLDFKNGGSHSIIHITDFKNSRGPVMKDLRNVSKKALILLQDNYPELIHKNIVINVPLWYYTVHMLRSRFLTRKTKKKFVLARPTKVTKTLLKFIAAENLPVQYGGLKREVDNDFSTQDKASELKVKSNSTVCIEFPVDMVGLTLVWDITVVGWEVSYKEEFIPEDESSYKILIQKQKKMGESVRNSFYINEPGKIFITIDNWSFKKKLVLYRSKAKPTAVPMYVFFKDQ